MSSILSLTAAHKKARQRHVFNFKDWEGGLPSVVMMHVIVVFV